MVCIPHKTPQLTTQCYAKPDGYGKKKEDSHTPTHTASRLATRLQIWPDTDSRRKDSANTTHHQSQATSLTHQHLLNQGRSHTLPISRTWNSSTSYRWQTPVAATRVCKNYSWWWTRTASETCRVVKINQTNRISCISLVFYKTSITKMHGTMNIKFIRSVTIKQFINLFSLLKQKFKILNN